MYDRYWRTYVDDGTPLVEKTNSDAFMNALLPMPRIADLVETALGIEFRQAPYREVREAVLELPSIDLPPRDPLDSRVFDPDGDRNPGMTVLVKALGVNAGETYIEQRPRYSLQGLVDSPDRMEGAIEWLDEQVVPYRRQSSSRSQNPPMRRIRIEPNTGLQWLVWIHRGRGMTSASNGVCCLRWMKWRQTNSRTGP